MKNLILFGSEDAASLARYYFELHAGYKVVAFTVDGDFLKEVSFEGVPVVPFESVEKEFPADQNEMHIAIGYSQMNRTRKEKYEAAKQKGYILPTYISPKCS